MALKCADISNPCRPWEISRKWSEYVCDEFFRQGKHNNKRLACTIMLKKTGCYKFIEGKIANLT